MEIILRPDEIPADLLEFFEPVPEGDMTDAWLLSPDAFPLAHFATFPREIPRRAILAGTSERGCCGACGAPWRRVVEVDKTQRIGPPSRGGNYGGEQRTDGTKVMANGYEAGRRYLSIEKGWQPTCPCGQDAPTVPATVLDCFSGAGTTGLVAVQLGRRYVGIELNQDYIAMSMKRIHNEGAPLFSWADSNGKEPTPQAVGS